MLSEKRTSGCGGGVRLKRHGCPGRAFALHRAALGGVVAAIALAGQATAQTTGEKVPTFEPAVEFTTEYSPWGIDAGDVIGAEDSVPDGYPEIAVVAGELNFYNVVFPNWSGVPGRVTVFRNNANWDTSPQTGLTVFQHIVLDWVNDYTVAADVKWADMNGDQRLDLVITATDNDFEDATDDGAWGFYVYHWNWTLQQFVFADYEATTYPVRGLTIADFNNDGYLDAAAAVDMLESTPPDQQRDYIYVALNDGTGGLLSDTALALGTDADESTSELVSGLFDKTPGGGGLPDIFTSRPTVTTGDALQLTNLGSGSWDAVYTTTSCADWFTGVAMGRFTSGKLTDDVVGIGVGGLLYVLHGSGEGGFGTDCSGNEPDDVYLEYGAPYNLLPYGVAVGNLNGGTKLDLVAARGTTDPNATVTILLGKGDGSFQFDRLDSRYYPALGQTADRPFRAVIADMDQDGFGDIITSNHGETNSTAGTISVLINKMIVSTTP